MPNNDETRGPDTGEGKKSEDESPVPETSRYAGHKHGFFDEDTEESFKLPKPTPEVSEDADADGKKADSAFDDYEIEIDEEEVKAESESQPPGRKY